MMSHRILSAALVLCALTAACGDPPTGSDTQARPAGPAYDGGGYTIGSGGNATASGGYTIGSGGGVAADEGSSSGTVSTEDSGTDDAERGGYTIGSGG